MHSALLDGHVTSNHMLFTHCMGPCNMANWDFLDGTANFRKVERFTCFYFSVILLPEFSSWIKSLKNLYVDVGTPLQHCLRGDYEV